MTVSAGVIEAGPKQMRWPDMGAAFQRAVEWFGGNFPTSPKVWDSGDRYTPVLAALDHWGTLSPVMKLLL